jgi:hypothetical protein
MVETSSDRAKGRDGQREVEPMTNTPPTMEEVLRRISDDTLTDEEKQWHRDNSRKMCARMPTRVLAQIVTSLDLDPVGCVRKVGEEGNDVRASIFIIDAAREELKTRTPEMKA